MTSTNLLNAKGDIPLEREYEAWTICAIERFLGTLGIKYRIWAVSPVDESTWPADERIHVGWKLVGLQFKRPRLAKLKENQIQPTWDRLKWELRDPPNQHNIILANQEIHYCLPIFTNRDYRKKALCLCLFWRPDSISSIKTIWYNNQTQTGHNTHRSINTHSKSLHWLQFIVGLLSCNVGKKLPKEMSLHSYLHSIPKSIRTSPEDHMKDERQLPNRIDHSKHSYLNVLAFDIDNQFN